ncbi:MAG: Na/Pi cotransporter family protein [Pseudomonadota bacterium]
MVVTAVHLAAGVALLLWSVRMVQTGVERAFMPEVKGHLKDLSKRKFSAAVGGGLAAMLFQSSTAVALVVAGFSISGLIAPKAALALLLGADLGSAIMAQILFLPVQAVIPFVLLFGVITFLKSHTRRTKQVGRIFIGFALLFMSLAMIREATAPMAENTIVQAIANYLQGDLLSAYFLGALLAWGMHSSLAAVLTFAAFASAGLIASQVAAGLVIGANLGGAIVPFALLWSGERPAKIVVLGNLVARGGLSIVFLTLLLGGLIPMGLFGNGAGQQAVTLNIAMNAALLLIFLPLTGRLTRKVERLVPHHLGDTYKWVSALDARAIDHPHMALACAQRELLRMSETVQSILVPVMQLFRKWDPDVARVIKRHEEDVDRMHYDIKIYVSRLRATDIQSAQERKTLEIVALANSLEDAADRIAVDLTALARKLSTEAISFSEAGLADIEHFHDQVATNGQLALSVLTSGDAEDARQLVSEKDRIRLEEQKLQERHLKRLQSGTTASLETSNIHQETLRLLKQINAALTYVAYPIVEETGDLLGSRLARRHCIEGTA